MTIHFIMRMQNGRSRAGPRRSLFPAVTPSTEIVRVNYFYGKFGYV